MGQVLTVITGGDPFEADRQSQYEGERRMAYLRCQQNLKKDVWQGVSGARDGNPAPRVDAGRRFVETAKGPDCNPGPWQAPSQRPSQPMPRMELKPPSNLKWGK